ncbi:MAG: signal peptide peptidase SppA [Gammaproteobacteria bacterium]|nr:signal peptide peptidase SppA [Gammaproteobacteria bacterium]MCY4218451.1 signal peptide peptidase SppA [Gammaproteobacteria bacterium]MCY4274525.1 signal peptide peptidase SppA [Gammaproteobacteria bacterium]
MIFRRSSKHDIPLTGEGLSGDTATNLFLAQVASDYIKESRSRRRWGLFFKLFFVVYLVLITYWIFEDDPPGLLESHTALISIEGVIGTNENTSENIIGSLESAFDSEYTKGIILSMNSPGGTPVQAARIYEEILRLRTLHPLKPFHVVVNDICASGGYYIAVAAENIYAHPSSLVGSIGVIWDSFGFTGAMEKLGIERRTVQAGKNKTMLDPFAPTSTEDFQHMQTLVDDVHDQFIEAVKVGRSGRIADDSSIYSGLIWSGQRARELGLIDDFGNINGVARDVIGEDHIIDYTIYPGVFEQIRREIRASISEWFSIGIQGFR